MELGLAGKPCIVTGASRGIGRATARLLAAEGARVLLAARGEEAMREAADECRAAGGDADSLALDVTAPDAGERLAARCEERLGPPWAVVSGAGTSRVRSLDQLTNGDFADQWELNVMASLRLM